MLGRPRDADVLHALAAMPDLLLEFLSEEIPARMQARAAEDLKKIVTDRLVAAGLVYEGAKAFATPRRLALSVHGVPVRQPDIKEEKKGPRVGAPANAIAGFLKAAGLTSIEQAKVQPDKKGDFYVAVIEKQGKPALEVLAEMIPEVVRAFPWPKSMRWGAGRLAWVRPLHSILATFGPETEDPDVVKFDVDGIVAGDETRGHRFMAPAAFKVRRFDDYLHKLEAAKVVLDPARRAEMILADAKNLAFAQGYELIEDDGLLAEVAGLVEWPVTLMGSFDAALLVDPRGSDPRHHPQQPEMLRAARRRHGQAHQQVHFGCQRGSHRRRQGDRRRQRARDPRAALRRQVLLRHRPEDAAGRPAAEIRTHRVPRKARFAGRAHRAHRCARREFGADCRRRCRFGRARRSVVQGRSAHRRGRRIPRAARPDGPLLRRGAERGRGGRARHRRSLPAEGAGRPGAGRSRIDRGRARRQDRHAGRFLGNRRKADRQQRPLRAATCGARHHPHRHRKRIAAAAAPAAVAALRRGSPRRKFGGSHRAAAPAARANLEFERDRYRAGYEARSPGVGEGQAAGQPGACCRRIPISSRRTICSHSSPIASR